MPDESEDSQKPSVARELHLQEWAALHVEVNGNAQESRDTERNVILASFLIWAWVLAQREFFYWPALLLPPLAVTLGLLRVDALGLADTHIGAYLRKIEDEYGLPTLGWEKHFRGPKLDFATQHLVGKSRRLFWRAMIVVSMAISAFIAFYLWNK